VVSFVCVSDQTELLPEVVTYSRSLVPGTRVLAVLFSSLEDERAAELTEYGIDTLFIAGVSSQKLSSASAASLIAQVLPGDTEAVVFASTKFSKEVAARLGGKLDAPFLTECRSVELTTGGAVVSRMVLSGNGIAKEEILKKPFIVTLVRGLSEPLKLEKRGTIKRLEPSEESGMATLEIRQKGGSEVKLEEAQRIVAVGRGIQKKEDLAMVERLAKLLDASIGCTRPIAADLGWLSDDQWIGLSGHKVKPKLYVALGISGQVQHIAGMRDSKVVVAVNKDQNAPIFANSDYCIVGDLYKFVPEFIKALEGRGAK
jgi:electron transfer flavoprotein alpha subunit